MRTVSLLAATLAALSTAAAERPLIIPAQGAPVEALEQEAPRRGLEVARPRAEPDVAAEAALAEVRPLYRYMQFGRAVEKLMRAEDALIAGRLPTPRLGKALAEIELWLGALELVDNKAAEANDRFVLARALEPEARPDRIFPPEVQAAFAHATPGPTVTPRLELSPPGARLYLDGAPAPAETSAGLHWVVVERADRRAVAHVMRITQAAPEIAVALNQPATPAEAVTQAAARAAVGPLGTDEGLGVSSVLGRPIWVVGMTGADRFAAGDVAHPTRHIDFAGAPIDAVCAVEPGCAAPKPPHRPIYKRAAFWVPVAAGVVLAVGAGILGATLSNTSTDYVVRIR